MSKLEAVIFDLDGTLVDSAPDIRQAVNLMLNDAGRPPLSLEAIKSFVGDGAMALCQRALEATGGLPEPDVFPHVQKFIGHLRKAKADPAQIYPKVRETLELLKEKELKIGMCTNKTEGLTLKLLEDLDLLRYFAFIAGGDTFTVHKPNPAHLLGVIEALDVPPTSCVYIGDGPADLTTATRALVPCVIITHGYSRGVENDPSVTLINHFDDLMPTLLSMGYEV